LAYAWSGAPPWLFPSSPSSRLVALTFLWSLDIQLSD
jgi:hypothetical protein